MSKEDFKISARGTFFGIKINTTGGEISRAMRASGLKRDQLLRRIMKLFRPRMEKRAKQIAEQLQKGIQELMGTEKFESSSHGSHSPHVTIPNPLSLIVSKGMRVDLKFKKDRISVSQKIYDRRDSNINFHTKMKVVPRISTVAQRLDATCLPFWRKGHATRIYERWLEFSRIGLYYALDEFLNPYKKKKGGTL